MNRIEQVLVILGVAVTSHATFTPVAHACGCLVMPDPSQPVVQAGERIVFAVKNSTVTAHIQIKYQGDPAEFGWLLPLPSEPTLELGSDELFTQLEATTAPRFLLTTSFANCAQGAGCGSATEDAFPAPRGAFGSVNDMATPANPLVVQDSIGPYDFAVLKAEDKTAMLDWLKTNRYLVPAGTDDVVAPYIHTGAFFLALKLKSGKSTGDIQPVVVHYASDLPMIPIVLTSVGATPDMGIEVFVLGSARAIPRNYHHTVINEAALDWNNVAANYGPLVTRAAKEAPDHHTFVTEFAGPTTVMRGVLDPSGRFGDRNALMALTDAEQFAGYLSNHGFTYPFTGTLAALLKAYVPMPDKLVAQGVPESQFYANLDQELSTWRLYYNGAPIMIDAAKLTADIWMRIVTPTLAAGALFTDFSFMTRLFTTLSPADMTEDPVFSFNPDLPQVSNVHTANMQFDCNGNAVVTTEDGFQVPYPGSQAGATIGTLPASLRIETLRESGTPTVLTDNTRITMSTLGQGGGCRLVDGASSGAWVGVLLPAGLALALSWRRRRRGPA